MRKTSDLEQKYQDLQHTYQSLTEELDEMKQRVELEEKASQELTVKLEDNKNEISNLREVLQKKISEHDSQREVMLRDATLDRYKALEEEQKLERLGLWSS